MNTLEPKDKGGASLENDAIQESKDLLGNSIPSKDSSDEAAEMAEVSTTLVCLKPER